MTLLYILLGIIIFLLSVPYLRQRKIDKVRRVFDSKVGVSIGEFIAKDLTERLKGKVSNEFLDKLVEDLKKKK
jgi:hypothetical protein